MYRIVLAFAAWLGWAPLVAAQSAHAAPVCVLPALDLDGRYAHLRPRLEGVYTLVVRVDGSIVGVRTERSSGNPAFDAAAAARLRTADCRNASRVRRANPADVRAVVEVPVTVSAAAQAMRVR
ncbi:hypothetical protein FOZ76_22210 [Verticiella sediminum]|uniref:TonB C-terminal domain-containing protein n=1 Tax=Verticiella sediminum TaxID=1247510 RepID=A0A556ACA8_9BURK|nr:TonB C-terminal domain-containing protein [Verticiella sediminum]TSH90526.1 hypothetical protein FOZ76_22210 [Verticiella sediminum]